MTDESSPYDELVEKVDYLIKAYDRLNQRMVHNDRILEDLATRIIRLEDKIKKENPGDINNLYQNWGKKR